MDIASYFSATDQGVSFSAQQASLFAKGVAGDFNPIHDVDNKRFCVPGDLLFAVLLDRYGCRAQTSVQFSGMLAKDASLALPEVLDATTAALHVKDNREREVLTFFSQGPSLGDGDFISRLSEEYVRFSGRTFPELLVPLMCDAGVMINPARPLVIYKDMSLRLSDACDDVLQLEVGDCACHVSGKKAAVRLGFTIRAGNGIIGEGEKNLVMGGLREFDQIAMQGVIDQYNDRKASFANAEPAI